MSIPILGEIDLGNGHTFEFTQAFDGTPNAGGIHTHKRPDGKECSGAITFRGFGPPERSQWDVISLEPLTLSPSILCGACGVHGYIREGKWVDC